MGYRNDVALPNFQKATERRNILRNYRALSPIKATLDFYENAYHGENLSDEIHRLFFFRKRKIAKINRPEGERKKWPNKRKPTKTQTERLDGG